MKMAKIIVTVTKRENDPWILLKKDIVNQVFTQDEIDLIIRPYIDYLKSMPGYLYDQSSVTINGNTAISEIVFDTNENLESAYPNLFGVDANEIVKNKNLLVRAKVLATGAEYQVSITKE